MPDAQVSRGMKSTADVAGFETFTRFMAPNFVLFEAVGTDTFLFG